jgi:hypothetical protein
VVAHREDLWWLLTEASQLEHMIMCQYVPAAPPREPLSAKELMPRGQEFLTVGHLYRGIEAGLRDSTARLGERGPAALRQRSR